MKGGAPRGSRKRPRRRPPLRSVRVGASAPARSGATAKRTTGGRASRSAAGRASGPAGPARPSSSPGYRVWLGAGALDRLVVDLASGRLVPGGPSRTVVVSDATVARLHGRAFVRALEERGLRATLLAFPAGERHKTRETKARLEDRLARMAFGRDGVVVALGGGVTGDLAGFLAATWHRGVPWVQAPTSVLGMLDASIGGKTGVDHPLGKNLLGAFHPPLGVYADTDTLATLPDRELRSGLAEAVKCGAIADVRLFRAIEAHARPIVGRDARALHEVLLGAARVKARIVSGDEREAGARMLLNFGHTLGHAVETAAAYGLRHGEAVAIGMALEGRLAVRMGWLAATAQTRIETLLRALGLPVRLPRGLGVGDLLAATARDKKVRAGIVRYVVPSRIGRHAGGGSFSVAVPVEVVRAVLGEAASRR